MKAPDKIYIHTDSFGFMSGYAEGTQPPVKCDAYICKDALLEWVTEQFLDCSQREEDTDDPVYWGQKNAFQQVIDKLNTL